MKITFEFYTCKVDSQEKSHYILVSTEEFDSERLADIFEQSIEKWIFDNQCHLIVNDNIIHRVIIHRPNRMQTMHINYKHFVTVKY